MLKLKSLTNSEKYSLNFFSIVLSASITAIGLCFIYFEVALELTNFQWGLLFTALMAIVVGLSRLNGISILSITSLFTLTIMLFLGGRFFAAIIDPTSEIFQLTYFANYKLNALHSTKLFFLVIIGIFGLQLGQYLVVNNQLSTPLSLKVPAKTIQILLTVMLPIFALVIGGLLYEKIIDVIQFGYLGLYKKQSQNEFNSRTLISLLNSFFYIFMGLAFAYGEKRQKKLYFILLCLFSLTTLLLGARAAFGSFLLFLLWIYGDFGRRRFSLLKFILFSILAMLLLNFLVETISFRELNVGSTLIDRLHKFLYTQGITLMVVDASMSIETYPTLAYFQSFIPGSAYIASLFSKVAIEDVSFANFLAFNLNYEMFTSGRGLGWSIYSDILLFSSNNIVLFTLLFTAVGSLLTLLEKSAQTSPWIQGLIVTITPKILYIARAHSGTVMPLVVYYIVGSLIVILAALILNRLKELLK